MTDSSGAELQVHSWEKQDPSHRQLWLEHCPLAWLEPSSGLYCSLLQDESLPTQQSSPPFSHRCLSLPAFSISPPIYLYRHFLQWISWATNPILCQLLRRFKLTQRRLSALVYKGEKNRKNKKLHKDLFFLKIFFPLDIFTKSLVNSFKYQVMSCLSPSYPYTLRLRNISRGYSPPQQCYKL